MKRKVRRAAILVFSLLFLVGWGKKSAELLNDKKLIDLEVALQVCLHGDSMSESDINSDNTKEPENTESSEAPTDTKESIDEGEKIIVISVRDQRVTYGAGGEIELNKLEYRIRQDYGDKVTVQLVDDFAEAHVYKRIKAMLASLNAEIGLEYTEGRGE